MGIQDDRELIPGTEVVFKGTDGEAISSQELVLIPKPTSNPDDPLNWSTAWKTTVIANQFLFVFISILTPLSIAPLTHIFMAEFDKTLPQVNLLFGVAAIVLGYANFLIVPLANRLGRRPVIIVCAVVCVLANIWQALVTSFGSFLAARVISGLGAAANESLMPMVVADLLFVHQRGRSMALYFWAYFLGIFVGPIIAGAIAARVDWRWFFWVCAILQGASLVFLLIAHPETKYDRPKIELVTRPRLATSTNSRHREGKLSGASTKTTFGGSSGRRHGISGGSGSGGDAASLHSVFSMTSASPGDADADSCYGRPVGAPTFAQFSPLPVAHGSVPVARGGAAARHLLLADALAPLRVFALPIVLWAALTFGFAANCLLALNLTEAQVFGAPAPYGFGAAQIGYTNFAFLVGAVIALATAGPLSDWVALRGARRNGGVLEAEMRLVAVVPYALACCVGMVVAAAGYQFGWPWEVVVVIGYGLVGVEVVGVPAVVIAYAVDCYKSLTGEIMIAGTVIKNTFGFAMVFFFNDWAARSGYLSPVLMLMAATVGLSVLGLALFIPFGKMCRRATRHSSLHML